MADLCVFKCIWGQSDTDLGNLLRHRGHLGWHVLLHTHAILHAHLHLRPHHVHEVAPQPHHGRHHARVVLPLPRVRRPHRVRNHQLQHSRKVIILTTSTRQQRSQKAVRTLQRFRRIPVIVQEPIKSMNIFHQKYHQAPGSPTSKFQKACLYSDQNCSRTRFTYLK